MPEPVRLPAQRQRPRPPARRGGVRRRSSSRPARDGEITRLRDVARIELAAGELRAPLAAGQQATAVGIGIFQAPGSNALQLSERGPRHDGGAEAELPRGRRVPDRLRPHHHSCARHPRGGEDAVRGDPARRARRGAVPADLAGLDHPAGGGAGLDRRHLRRPARRSASPSTRCRCSGWCWPSASWWTTPSWWSRTSSGTSRPGSRPREASYKAMEEVSRPDHRHRAGALRRVRAGGASSAGSPGSSTASSRSPSRSRR